MLLPDFIDANLDSLVDDWAEFASQIGLEGAPLTPEQLQDSARMMLTLIAADMRQPQTDAMQKGKSRGEHSAMQSDVTDAAHVHAVDRLGQGFKLDDLIAEFRALRATVLRRWSEVSPPGATAFTEMIRFNEAIDQSLTESIKHYSKQVEELRDRFAGVLAHDLRSPLGAIINSAEFLLRGKDVTASQMRAALNVQRGASRMKRMVDDLLDFTRTRLGDLLPIERAHQDLGRLCIDASNEIRAAYPQAKIDVSLKGDLTGDWDGGRLSQLFANLLGNAVQHGSGPIAVSVMGDSNTVKIKVANGGLAIPQTSMATLFDPLTRAHSSTEERGWAAGIGLGLYICRCIARAHGGEIDVSSSDDATVFVVEMPRRC
jgi:signal transduction histidine kinase